MKTPKDTHPARSTRNAVLGAALKGLLLAAVASGPALANQPERSLDHDTVINSEGFLSAHPDLRWRRAGLLAYEEGRLEEAANSFRRAARYADKASQAMYAEMLWNGQGVEQDRIMAYAWMDLAAERAYLPFVVRREKYWETLSEAERERVLAEGRVVYDEYGDAVAKPRLERLLKQAKRNVTGSRVGNVGNVEIMIPGPGGVWRRVSGEEFYQPQFWEPEEYWAWQDQVWRDPRTGHVEILPIEKVPSKPESGDR